MIKENIEEKDIASESVWRLNRCYVSYRPLDEAPDVAPLPMLERKVPMIGSFNQSRKITEETAQNWMEALNAIPESHLYLKSKNLGEREAKRVEEMFKRLGLDKDRIHLEGHSANVKIHLDRYRI